MGEIKPVEGALLVDGRVVLVDENYPAQRKEGASIYSQQAIDSLRAEVERLEVELDGLEASEDEGFYHLDDIARAISALGWRDDDYSSLASQLAIGAAKQAAD